MPRKDPAEKKDEEKDKEYLAARLRELMNAAGHSYKDLINQAGMLPGTRNTIGNALSGEASMKTYGQLLRVYNYDINSLLRERATDAAAIDRFILHQGHLTDPRTEVFVGRKHVFRRIDAFLGRQGRGPGGYFILKGHPGVGKSAVAANLPAGSSEFPNLPKGYVSHFNNRSTGPRSRREFFGNVCARIIRRFALPYRDIPADEAEGAAFLMRVLDEAARSSGDRLVVVVDALDESDDVMMGTSLSEDRNVLGLPQNPPDGVNFILTTRPEDYILACDRPKDGMVIDVDSPENVDDVTEYIARCLERRPGVAAFAARHDLGRDEFVELLLERSEKNFLYLHHVFADMEDPGGGFAGLDAIPRGIWGYYEQHWRRMKSVDLGEWTERRLPVIAAYVAQKTPKTVEQLRDLTGVSVRALPTVLRDWQQFVRRRVNEEGVAEYQMYHSRYLDFLEEQPEVRDSLLVDEMRARLNDSIFGDLEEA